MFTRLRRLVSTINSRRIIFDLWYFRNPPWDTGITPPELLAFLESRPPGRALDLGCGTGTNVIQMARRGWSATGVDFSPRAITIARRKATLAGVKAAFHVDDVTRLEGIEGPFDLVLDIGCLHNLPDGGASRYLANLERLLAENGAFLLYGFFKGPGGSGPGLSESTVERLSGLLKLISRQDGTDRGRRPSAWFSFQRPQKA
ncbi:MAG: class I SAM-dependent methyltransferase [Anaerolineales bacterium]|nr:class I SAM-dependent methyltransferase [Anaerolineales bacterium]